jgi:hypothetical protein
MGHLSAAHLNATAGFYFRSRLPISRKINAVNRPQATFSRSPEPGIKISLQRFSCTGRTVHHTA